MEIFDLTYPLDAATPVHQGDPPVVLTHARSHDADGYEVTQICLGSHSGTHLDAPRHFFRSGATLDRYPPERLMGPGVVVDARPVAGKGDVAPGLIDAVLLADRLRLFPVAPGGFVLLWTEGAMLTIEAAQALLETGAGLVGTDAPSLDTEPYPVHRLFLGHGLLIAENLCGLDRVGSGPVSCAFLPLAVVGTDGAPVRAIAWR
jgi:kynurenine formamidase